MRRACDVRDDDAYFTFDSSALRSQDMGRLNALAQCFSSGPLAGKTMEIVGRADPRGSADYNVMLGRQRAAAVAQYFEQHGLAPAHVQTTSRGAADDTATGAAAWQKDRRVDILVGS